VYDSVSTNTVTNWVYVSNTLVINSNYMVSYGYDIYNISNQVERNVISAITNVLTNSVLAYQTTNFLSSNQNFLGIASNYNSYNEVVYVWTFAGSGSGTFADGTGTNASFHYPYEIDIDSSGNLYVGDSYNHRVRKVTTNGVVTTLAGSGGNSYADGTGTGASFNYPQGIAVDSNGNVFVGDLNNNRIRKVTPAGVVTTYAGSSYGYLDGTNTNAQFRSPNGLAVDNSGNIYLADFNNYRIRKIDPDGIVTTVAGTNSGYVDGFVTNAKFNHPSVVTLDSNGNMIVSDFDNFKIRKITPAGDVTTIGASGSFGRPCGVVADNYGNVFVADMTANRIQKISATGVVTVIAGSGTSAYADGIGTNASIYQPAGLVFDSSGNLFVSDQFNNRIRKITGVH
jgi:sugar lactone lactonase YvrE